MLLYYLSHRSTKNQKASHKNPDCIKIVEVSRAKTIDSTNHKQIQFRLQNHKHVNLNLQKLRTRARHEHQ